MSDWKKEFPDEYRPPDVVQAMVRAGALTDESWHNDVSPSFGAGPELENQPYVKMWVDCEDPELRELGGDRYHVQRLVVWGDLADGYEDDFLVSTDRLELALAVAFREVARYCVRPVFPLLLEEEGGAEGGRGCGVEGCDCPPDNPRPGH